MHLLRFPVTRELFFTKTPCKHIATKHPEIIGAVDAIKDVLEQPSHVIKGTTPQNVVFLSERVLNAHRAPLYKSKHPCRL